MDFKQYLESLKNEKQQAFISKLAPNIPKERFLGLKNPQMREIVKNLTEQEKEFILNQKEFTYVEEKMIYRFIIEKMKDYNLMMKHLNNFIPHIDSWITCDAFDNKSILKNKDDFIKNIKIWINSGSTYTIRFAINMLMKYYLDEDFKPIYMVWVENVDVKDEYYLKMIVALYFATALAKQYDYAIKVLENHILEPYTHNKTIQKAIESFRINDELKTYLRTLKVHTK